MHDVIPGIARNGRTKKVLALLMCIVVLFCCMNHVVYAYQYTGRKLSNPLNTKFKISTTASTYTTAIITYTGTWETYCSEIDVSYVSLNENIYFYGDLAVNNGTYAITYSYSNDYHNITLYMSFANATSAQRNEVIVHEVGHALGLDHCEPANQNISVMRSTGFNNKAYPLSDDISGIANLY